MRLTGGCLILSLGGKETLFLKHKRGSNEHATAYGQGLRD